MEMRCTQFFGDKLVRAVRNGVVSEIRINESALRIARTITAFEEAYRESGKNYGEEVLRCKEHRALSLRAVRKIGEGGGRASVSLWFWPFLHQFLCNCNASNDF
jgi:hypothetical protein